MASNSRKNLCPHGRQELRRCLDHSLRTKLVDAHSAGEILSTISSSVSRRDCI
ncbi:hypothetical protein MtrunA17_Chr3g0085781 [Medicago truncatula]|uniref:Uncharacterized protein n=1 Tax=Medicago truncatula TaxID=3880 RepID=A0A396INQ2_MEDTR|nr:hypothetical protein MtrunA17_Chr3g0085781 [Medicago truncatula]